VHWGCDDATAVNIEVHPQRRRFGSRESDFTRQGLIECRAAKTELVRVVLLWHCCGSEVRLGLPVGRSCVTVRSKAGSAGCKLGLAGSPGFPRRRAFGLRWP
jgi:hypothetical protein